MFEIPKPIVKYNLNFVLAASFSTNVILRLSLNNNLLVKLLVESDESAFTPFGTTSQIEEALLNQNMTTIFDWPLGMLQTEQGIQLFNDDALYCFISHFSYHRIKCCFDDLNSLRSLFVSTDDQSFKLVMTIEKLKINLCLSFFHEESCSSSSKLISVCSLSRIMISCNSSFDASCASFEVYDESSQKIISCSSPASCLQVLESNNNLSVTFSRLLYCNWYPLFFSKLLYFFAEVPKLSTAYLNFVISLRDRVSLQNELTSLSKSEIWADWAESPEKLLPFFPECALQSLFKNSNILNLIFAGSTISSLNFIDIDVATFFGFSIEISSLKVIFFNSGEELLTGSLNNFVLKRENVSNSIYTDCLSMKFSDFKLFNSKESFVDVSEVTVLSNIGSGLSSKIDSIVTITNSNLYVTSMFEFYCDYFIHVKKLLNRSNFDSYLSKMHCVCIKETVNTQYVFGNLQVHLGPLKLQSMKLLFNFFNNPSFDILQEPVGQWVPDDFIDLWSSLCNMDLFFTDYLALETVFHVLIDSNFETCCKNLELQIFIVFTRSDYHLLQLPCVKIPTELFPALPSSPILSEILKNGETKLLCCKIKNPILEIPYHRLVDLLISFDSFTFVKFESPTILNKSSCDNLSDNFFLFCKSHFVSIKWLLEIDNFVLISNIDADNSLKVTGSVLCSRTVQNFVSYSNANILNARAYLGNKCVLSSELNSSIQFISLVESGIKYTGLYCNKLVATLPEILINSYSKHSKYFVNVFVLQKFIIEIQIVILIPLW